MPKKPVFRVIFHNQGKVYEVYASRVTGAELFGFVAIEGLRFSETDRVVVDPHEEQLKREFSGVDRTLVPMHAVVRIDEVKKAGVARIGDAGDTTSNVTPFPMPVPPRRE